MICLIALITFGVLGIFSANYRKLAKEAFTCVFRRITLRNCPANLNNRLKLRAVFKISKVSPKLARVVKKHFELISWALTILLIVSLALTARSGYNLAVHGTCDPETGECIFTSGEISCGSEDCKLRGCDCDEIGCEKEIYEACEGSCECIKDVC